MRSVCQAYERARFPQSNTCIYKQENGLLNKFIKQNSFLQIFLELVFRLEFLVKKKKVAVSSKLCIRKRLRTRRAGRQLLYDIFLFLFHRNLHQTAQLFLTDEASRAKVLRRNSCFRKRRGELGRVTRKIPSDLSSRTVRLGYNTPATLQVLSLIIAPFLSPPSRGMVTKRDSYARQRTRPNKRQASCSTRASLSVSPLIAPVIATTLCNQR